MTLNQGSFFTAVRSKLPSLLNQPGPLMQAQVNGIESVLAAIDGLPLSWQAYALATAWHETNKTMQPVAEAYWVTNAEAWRKANLRYWPWYGRGYVELTWEQNYAKADAALAKAGLIKAGDLLANADLALRPDLAAVIMRQGMLEGWFSGAKFSTTLPAAGVATRDQYMLARTMINGHDKADLIEDYAQAFEWALRAGCVT